MRNRSAILRPGIGAVLIVISFVLVACAPAIGAPLPSDQPGTPPPSVAAPNPSVPASPPPVDPTLPPVEPSDPPPTPRPVVPADPTPTPAPSFTVAELDLIRHIRPDAREDCTPRRTNLPDRAVAGVECRPSAGPALRIGFYAFTSNRNAARAYFDRLVTSGVGPNSGNCYRGEPGDEGWVPGDGEPSLVDDEELGIVVANSPYVTLRQGCFVDEGTANVRITCGFGIYAGILGRDDDVAALTRWVGKYPDGVPMTTPTPPGLCIGGEDQA